MIITIKEILEADGNDLAMEGYRNPICRLERGTLEQFSNVSFDVSPEALPLIIFLMGGNIKKLAVFPSPGGKIIRPKGEVEFNKKGYKLCILPNPHTDK